MSKMFEGNEAIFVPLGGHGVRRHPARLPHKQLPAGLFLDAVNCCSVSVNAPVTGLTPG